MACTCRCHCFAYFLKTKRNLEHVRSMICAVQSLSPSPMVSCLFAARTCFKHFSKISSPTPFTLVLSCLVLSCLVFHHLSSLLSLLFSSFLLSRLSSFIFSCFLVLCRLILFSLVLSLFLCLSFSVFFLCLFSLSLCLSLSLSVSLCLSLSPCDVVCCVVWCVSLWSWCCWWSWCVWCVCVCVFVCVLRHAEKTKKKPVFGIKKRLRVHIQNVPVCTGTTRTCVSTFTRGAGTHGDVLNVHTEAFLKPHTGSRGSSSVLLSKICPRTVITCFRGSPKKLLDLSCEN